MSWFGWLTKPTLEVSALDRVIGFSEFFAVWVVVMLVLFLTTKKGKK